jgi:hypothetical protein
MWVSLFSARHTEPLLRERESRLKADLFHNEQQFKLILTLGTKAGNIYKKREANPEATRVTSITNVMYFLLCNSCTSS